MKQGQSDKLDIFYLKKQGPIIPQIQNGLSKIPSYSWTLEGPSIFLKETGHKPGNMYFESKILFVIHANKFQEDRGQ